MADIATFADLFPGTELDTLRWDLDSTGPEAVSGGVLLLQGSGTLSSVDSYTFAILNSIEFEVFPLYSASWWSLELRSSTTDLGFSVESGTLDVRWVGHPSGGDHNLMAYDLDEHRFLRFTRSRVPGAGPGVHNLFLHTSGDGVTWTLRNSGPVEDVDFQVVFVYSTPMEFGAVVGSMLTLDPATDIGVRLTTTDGSAGDTVYATPGESLGKYVSTATLGTGYGALFDDLDVARNAGGVDYRAVAVVNNHPTLTLHGVVVTLEDESPAGAIIALAVDSAAASDKASTTAQGDQIPDGATAPDAVEVFDRTPPVTGQLLGYLEPGQVRFFWVRRTGMDTASGFGGVTLAVYIDPVE